MAELRPNRVKHKLREGKPAIVVQASTGESIERLGTLGIVDGIWIEMEHGPTTWADLENFSRACDLWGMTSMVRLHHEQAGMVGRAMDLGMQGVIIPHVSTKEDAQRIVHHAKFAPLGLRGMSGPRQGYGVPGYMGRANDETLITVLIEEMKAVRNLADMLTVDHIDCFFVAPGDLSQSLGAQYLGNHGHPDVQAVIDQATRQIVAAGKHTGTVVDDNNVEHYRSLGAQFFLVPTQGYVNAGLMGFSEHLATSKAVLPQKSVESVDAFRPLPLDVVSSSPPQPLG